MQNTTKENNTLYPALTPLKSDWMQQLVREKYQLFELLKNYPSPVNIHYLEAFGNNYCEFEQVFQRYGLEYQVYFARKANKCKAFVHEAKKLGFGVDTASFRELKQCLQIGCAPTKLVLTAAIKKPELLSLAITYDIPIILDNEDECTLLNDLAKTLGKTPKVGIRVSGFYYQGKKLYSRFGFDIDQVETLIHEKIGENKTYDQLRFTGFHFHLNGYSMAQRSEAIIQIVGCIDQLKKQGITTHFIDMGGGILINYLSDKEQWEHFNDQLKQAVLGKRLPLTFHNNGLGIDLVNGQLSGKAAVYPYFNETPRATFIKAVLNYSNEEEESVAKLLSDRNLEIRIEPGRSMLDQCGMTVAKVAYRKYDSESQLLIGLEMNRTQMFSSSADYLLDPIVIYQHGPAPDLAPISAYFVGAYCLEQDIILKRKISLPAVPEIGDLVCFFNTAGYMMHFYESEAHLFDLAANLIATKKESDEGFFAFTEDDHYS